MFRKLWEHRILWFNRSILCNDNKRWFKKMKKIMYILIICLITSGCSVFMAAKQPGKKNVALFKAGTPRSILLAEFGNPIVSEERNGKKYEIFKFVQGYSAGAKAGRAVFHGAADVLTLGVWEVVGTPTEGVFSGKELSYEVSYDENNRIDSVINLNVSTETK